MCSYWEITPELTFESLINDYTSFLQKYKAISYFLSYFYIIGYLHSYLI